MKMNNVVWKKLLKVSLAATFAVTPLMMRASVAQAAPSRNAPAKDYRDKGYKNNKDNKKDDNRNGDRNDYQTMTGQVSNVKGQQFDLRVGNTTYNVYASSRLPNGLNQGDSVRVYGQRYGDNDIRNANVSVIGNNSGSWNNNGNNNRWDNNYQTFTGQVSNVQGQQFDLRVGGTTYNVYASSRLPDGVNQNHTVRVYGQRYGENDIRNANVSIISSSNDNNRWNNNNYNNSNNGENYQTFTGTVTNVKSSSEFDVRIGNDTYNVYPSGNTPNQLSKNDSVRIYGQRYGDNDIRNASVTLLRNR